MSTSVGVGGSFTTSTGAGGGNASGTGGGTADTTVIYAHTDTDLFSVDPHDPTFPITHVGAFDCVGTDPTQVPKMTDIAVSKDLKLYGLATKSIYLDMTTTGGVVHCAGKGLALNAPADFFGASFTPAGTLDPTKERLIVGGAAGVLYAVDTTAGTVQPVGRLGNVPKDDGNGHAFPFYTDQGTAWELSGDLVFLENNGKPVGFATGRDCPMPPYIMGCHTTDTLLELDPTKLSLTADPNNLPVVTRAVRGQVVKAAGCNDPANPNGYGNITGVAAFQGKVLGFARVAATTSTPAQSLLVGINNTDGTACLISDDTTLAPGGWAGAGVTTLAPIISPPPK